MKKKTHKQTTTQTDHDTLNITTNNNVRTLIYTKTPTLQEKGTRKTISPLASYFRLVGAFADVTSTHMQKKLTTTAPIVYNPNATNASQTPSISEH